MSNREIAEKVSAKLGTGVDYSGQTVGGWLRNQWVPDPRVIAVLAEVFRCDPGWLTYGKATLAPSPDESDKGEIQSEAVQRMAEILLRESRNAPTIPETRGTAPAPVGTPHRRRASGAKRGPQREA